MKRSSFLWLFLLSLAALAVQNASAGSAVAVGSTHAYLVTSYGYSKAIAEQRALLKCRQNGGVNPRILAATDELGYGAVAVGDKGTGSVISVALGKSSRAEAATLAIEKCVRHGGHNPKIIREFRDPPTGSILSVR
jgi:hypothetical protein